MLLTENILHGVYSVFDTLFPSLSFTLVTTVQCYGLDRSIMGMYNVICTMSCIGLSLNKGLTDGIQVLADIRIF